MKDEKVLYLFDNWEEMTLAREEWQDMPEYSQEDLMPWKSIKVHFRDREDMQNFMKLVEQKITDFTKYIWFPKAVLNESYNKRYIDEF